MAHEIFSFDKEWDEVHEPEIYQDIEHTKAMLEYAKLKGDLQMVEYYASIIARLL